MASPPVTLEYYIGRMGVDPERTKLNKILRDIEARFLALGAGSVNQYVTWAQLEEIIADLPTGGGVVETIAGGYAISVDSSDPANPIVEVVPADLISTDADNQLVLGGDGGLYVADTGGGGEGMFGADFDADPGDIIAGKQQPTTIPYNWTINSWRIMGDSVGNVVFDVQRQTSLGGSSSSIVGSAPPTMTGASTASSSTLTGWTVNGNAGDIITIIVSSAAGLIHARLELLVTKS